MMTYEMHRDELENEIREKVNEFGFYLVFLGRHNTWNIRKLKGAYYMNGRHHVRLNDLAEIEDVATIDDYSFITTLSADHSIEDTADTLIEIRKYTRFRSLEYSLPEIAVMTL